MTYRRLTVATTRDVAPVSRRDFLKLRVSEGRRILELSCESLYMRYEDARSGAARRQVSNHEDSMRSEEACTGFDTPKPDELFAELERQLAEANELRVLGHEWLDGGAFGREVRAHIEAFRRRGGRVEPEGFSTVAPPPEEAPGS
jgi:hypothetical protein